MTLRLRLTLLTAGVIFLSLAAFGGLAGVLLWRIELSSITRQITAQADALMAVASRSPGALPDTAADLLERDSITAVGRVYEDGVLIWAGGAVASGTLDSAFLSAQIPERISRSQDYLVASRRFSASSDGNAGDGPERGVVQVGRSLRPLEQLLTRYVLIAALSLLLLSALGGVSAALAVRRALTPLDRLVRRVQHLSTSDPVPGTQERSEVGALARALDTSLAELRAERRRESLFLASASHELRTPVTAMLADLQHTLARERSPEEVLAALHRTERTAGRLRQLTGNLMSLTRAQHLGERQTADLLDLAGEAIDLLQPLALKREIDLWLEGAPTPALVDASLLSGVLENLIGNALKFSPEGGQVSVRVLPLRGGAELIVEDSGPGFPTGPLTEAFVRGVSAHKAGQAPEGFGLGLAVVRQVVEAHGGSLELGERAGGGARVRVVLPAAPARPSAEKAETELSLDL
ncbi:HAMP domain-containing histidine kinase [Deinococcus detaillensis]|uniref:histidine kinase n=1 Tax=Deinococcus detaillensis TaxID=2592048 RepID=A0A553V434_9DEIO|nr:HAMP domain-containing sensor histidine kinase [Deinococcus detaillensis]TSA87154.1 HAMP domain-containing histidine kinase [Deinococcus detaillensis]